MGKNIIQISEANLRGMISETVKKVLMEGGFDSLPHLISKYDPSREEEYSETDRLIAKLEPLYHILSEDTFFGNEKPQGNLNSLAAAKRMCKLLNEFFGGDYIEVVRGGADVILSDEDWFEGAYDLTEEWCNYSLQAKNGTPHEIKDELNDISKALAHGYLPGVADKIKAQDAEKERQEREKNGGLKVLGKIDLDKVDPQAKNKKRW